MALTDLQMLFASFSAWKQNECDDNREAICAAKNVLPVIMEECCTKKQRVYMTAFFIDNLNVQEISEKFCVAESTVSRTIHRGLDKMYGYARFSHPVLINAPPPSVRLKGGKRRKKKSRDDTSQRRFAISSPTIL